MKNSLNIIDKRIEKDMAYQHLQCVDWLTIVAKLSGVDISSKPIRDMEKKYFKEFQENVNYNELAKQLSATEHSILQKIPNEEGMCAINPTCVHREESFYLEEGLFKTAVDGYRVSKLEKVENNHEELSFDDEKISNGKITISFDQNGQVKSVDVKERGKYNKQFNKIDFLSKTLFSNSLKNHKYKNIYKKAYINDENAVVRENVFNYKLNSVIQQISLKSNSLDIDVKIIVLIKDNNSQVRISFDSEDGFVSIADSWPGYENLYIGKDSNMEISIFTINSKILDKKVVLETNGKGKYNWNFTIHINEVDWQESNLAEVYQSRSMPLIISNMTPKIRPIIELDNLSVLVTKLRLSSNGKYVLVRLKEMYGQDCECAIKAGFRAKGVYEIDDKNNMLAITNSKIKFKPNSEFNIAFEL